MKIPIPLFALLQIAALFAALILAGDPAHARAKAMDTIGPRIVFLGDSITDGFTQALMVQQALAEAYRPIPVVIDAGVASDTAAQMLTRLDRDVFSFKPGMVIMLAGANDALRGVTPDVYKANVDAIAKAMRARNIAFVVMTPTTYGPSHQDAEKTLVAYADDIHELAAADGFKVAEVLTASQDARNAGHPVNGPDGVHINYDGYRVMTRAILDAMGYSDVLVPKVLKPTLYPGVVTPLFIKPLPDDAKPLTDDDAKSLAPDSTWFTLNLPIPVTHPDWVVGDEWWPNQIRQQGYVTGLDKALGLAKPAHSYVGFAALDSPKAHGAFISAGVAPQKIWLNGALVYDAGPDWRGYHAGRDRVPVKLLKGSNRIVFVTGGDFFLSVTDERDWEDYVAVDVLNSRHWVEK